MTVAPLAPGVPSPKFHARVAMLLPGAIEVSVTASKEDIEKAALATEVFAKQANGGLPKKVIVVPGRLVNIVL